MEFTSKYLNSLKTLHSLKTLPHPNTLKDLSRDVKVFDVSTITAIESALAAIDLDSQQCQ